MFYNIYRTTSPKGPPNTKAFADSFRRDAPRLAEALDKGTYYLFPRVRGGSGVVLAFEVAGDTNGNHIVVMGDGSVQEMTRHDLEAYWKKHGK